MKAVKVLIADPRPRGAEALATVLAENPRIEVVATALTGAECIRKSALTHPHVVVMDLKFRDMEASEIVEELVARELKVAVYVVGPEVSKENPLLMRALKAGAFEYLRCRPGEADTAALKRQLANTIFVAGLSASKQIPCKEGTRTPPDLEGLLKSRELVIVGWANERLAELPDLMARLRVGPACDLILVVGVPMDEFEKTMSILSEIVGPQGRPVGQGVELSGGHLYVTPRRPQDLAIERSSGGRCSLSFVERRTPKETGPSLDRLFQQAAQQFKKRVAGILVGGDGSEGTKGLKAIAEAGGVTLVDDLSVELLAALAKQYPDGSIPSKVVPMEDLRILLKEIEPGAA
ncbi:MAG: response regulator [Candidatus Riflebacteria bacterium]|nr:response regulator [Candidatus Riflebacteria bacterium]